jgi:uncharacterized protein (DUF1697 family)
MSNDCYIGLLRGINVGGANRLPMKELMAAAADADFSQAQTYLQSGNIVFRAKGQSRTDIPPRLNAAIRRRVNLDIPVIIRDSVEWSRVIDANPFPEAAENPKSLHVFILAEQPESTAIRALEARDFGTDRWRLTDDALYLHLPDGIGRSKLGGSVERILKVAMTARNWTTMIALRDLANALDDVAG